MKKHKKSSRNIDADSGKAGIGSNRYGKWTPMGRDRDLSRSQSREKDKRLGDSVRSIAPSRRSRSSEKGTRHRDSRSTTFSVRTRSPEKYKRARNTGRSITPSRRSRSPEKGKRFRDTGRSITRSRSRSPEKGKRFRDTGRSITRSRSGSPEKDRKHRVSKSIAFSSRSPTNVKRHKDSKSTTPLRRSKSPGKAERYRDSRSLTPAKRSRSPVKDKMYKDSRRSYTPSKRSSSPENIRRRRNSRSTTPAKRSKPPGKYKRHRDSRRSYTPSEGSRSEHENCYERASDVYKRASNDYKRTSQHFISRQCDYEEQDKNCQNSSDKTLDRNLGESIRSSKDINKEPEQVDSTEPLSRRVKIGNINMRTGGAYIPPARLRLMQEQIKDKGSEEYQKIAWEALKKSIIGMTNKVNSSNIGEIVPELLKENIIRGRGVLARAIIQAQAASPTFTRVYAALVAIINTKFPEIGELILKRLIIQYKRGFRRNNKDVCLTAARFLAHLLNQEVAHEVLILEVVTHLLENPTEDSVEIAIVTLKECGKKLTQLTASGMRAITQRVRDVLHEGKVDIRVRYMIEVFFAVQKDHFKDFETIPPELDLVEEEDKYTHFLNLDDEMDNQEMLNIFQFDPEYAENEEKYKAVVKEILGDDSEEEGSGDEGGSEEEEEEAQTEENQQIIDMTETNIVCLRRKIYLTIQSSLDFEECAHKLLKLELKPGQILEMCYMILDCCAQQRTYEKFFGLLAQRFCQLNKVYVEPFTEIFENSYKTIHRLETNKLRNVAKFFAHLLYTDAISWMVLSNIKLNEEDTTSSSRIFIKILFQELCEYMGLPKLNERVKDVTLQEAFDGLFPRDHSHNTRFAVNFFTSIGLGGLTDELREHLKNLPKAPLPVVPVAASPEHASSGSSSSSSSTSSSSSSSSSSSDSDSDSDQSSERTKRKQKRKK